MRGGKCVFDTLGALTCSHNFRYLAQKKLIQASIRCHQNCSHRPSCCFVICTSGQILFGDKIKTRKAGHVVCIGDRKKCIQILGLKT
jgi:hypothetical protein